MARHASLHSGLTSSSSGNRVYLNVYDLNDNNAIWYPWGLGLYHSGVQLGREEYTFGMFSLVVSYNFKDLIPLIFVVNVYLYNSIIGGNIYP